MSLDRFRGILRLGYQGDAWLEVRCRVQANPLSHNPNLLPSSTLPLSTPLLASQPLLVPMTLRLSKLHLRAILILVVSKAKGITLVFKNDPLQNVDVSSTFDSVEVIRGYLQQEIEGQLREMFREDLPGIIHRLSQRWFTGTGVGGRVEMPYREADYAPSTSGTQIDDDDDVFSRKEIFPPPTPVPTSPNLTPRRRVSQKIRDRRPSMAASESPTSYTVFPEIEEYDPTYGLRPEGVPTHSGYEAFGRLWEKARQGEGKGLGALMSNPDTPDHRGDVSDEDWDEDEGRSFDMTEVDASLPAEPRRSISSNGKMPRSQSARSLMSSSRYEEDEVEWESFPAVGGGLISRPRVYHSQSLIRAPSEAGGTGAMPSPSGTATQGSVTARASSVGAASSTVGVSRSTADHADWQSLRMRPAGFPSPMTAMRAGPSGSGPGPSSLSRLVTSRSDVFLSHQASRSESHPRGQMPPRIRRLSATGSSSAARTSGSSWDTDRNPNRSGTASTKASSQLPSSRSAPIDAKANTLHPRARAPSLTGTSPGKSFPPRHIGPGGITLPLNNSVSQLATLSHSAQTLSPYARGHEHIAVRSFPHLGKAGPSAGSSSSASLSAIAENQPGAVKARRKRIFHLNKDKEEKPPLSPDIDDEVSSPGSYYRNESSSPSPMRSRSPSSDFAAVQARRPLSLTSVAQKVMGGGMRPNYGRAPGSRTSYGFPPVGSQRL